LQKICIKPPSGFLPFTFPRDETIRLPVSEFHSYEWVRELTVTEESPYNGLFAETVSSLVQQGWLLCNPETDSYKMHRIIADVVKKQHAVSVNDIDGLITRIGRTLVTDYTRDNPIEKFPWIPFGKAILDSLGDSTSEKIGLLQNNLAAVLQDLGDYNGASFPGESCSIRGEEFWPGASHYGKKVYQPGIGTSKHESAKEQLLGKFGNWINPNSLTKCLK
jgi:hypothetical protein